jgi:two-component system response regulator DevR
MHLHHLKAMRPALSTGVGRHDDGVVLRSSASTVTDCPPGAYGQRYAITGIVIIDDHLLLADAVAGTINSVPDLAVVGIAANCTDGLELVHTARPEVILLDQRLPDGRGTDLLPALLNASPASRILLVTGSDDDDVLRLAIEGGCAGFITKGERAASLLAAVRKAAAGETVLSPANLARLLPAITRRRSRVGHDLTARELDVLRLLAEGRPTSEIASELFIVHATARNHIQSVISKLGAHSRLEAVTIALREKIVGDT